MDTQLRRGLIRLAHTNPELRPHLLPLLKQASQSKKAHGPVSMRDPAVMLFAIDQARNQSKFYEMAIVPLGKESPAKKTQDKARGAGTHVLMRRWGRLTDSGLSGRVDSINMVLDSQRSAEAAMQAIKRDKMSGGGSAVYTDVSRTRKYPIGLGAAGFGWGGQAACEYIPELRELQGQVAEMVKQLSKMTRVTQQLSRQRSGLAGDLTQHLGGMAGPIEALEGFLADQLSHCK